MGMGEPILVVEREYLFSDGGFQGFISSKKKDYLSRILSNYKYEIRSPELEKNPALQQPIPYVWIVNPKEKKAFLYKRAKTGNEGRLHNKFSGGVGGHIDKNTEENSKNPIHDAMMRELMEEVVMEHYPVPNIIGYINDDADPVGQVHFGLVALCETLSDVKPLEDMSEGKFYTIEEVENIFSNSENDIENWTRLSWPFIKEYLISN